MIKLLTIGVLLSAGCAALDLEVPVEGGVIEIADVRVENSWVKGTLRNKSAASWLELVLNFEMTATCEGTPRKWSGTVKTAVGFSPQIIITKRLDDILENQQGRGCVAEVVSASLVSSRNIGVYLEDYEKSVARAAAARAEAEEAQRKQFEAEMEQAREVEAAAKERRRAAELEAALREAAEASRLAKLPTLLNTMAAIFVASDVKCSQEYQSALTLGGLEQRKKLAELIAYNCGFVADPGDHVSVISRQGVYAFVAMEERDAEGKKGWVPSAWIKAPPVPRQSKAKAAK